MNIDDADIRSITESIWSSVLGMDLRARPELKADAGDAVVTAFVLLSGASEGAVMLQCATPLARRSAGTMFDTPHEAVSSEEVNDALGELANMVGGNVKNLLSGSYALSVPAVINGRDYTVQLPGIHVLKCLAFESEGDVLLVSILELDRPQAPTARPAS